MTNLFNLALTSGDLSTIGGVLDVAGQLVTWLITQMGAFLTFITSNPIVAIPIILLFAGAGIGFLGRIMHTAG